MASNTFARISSPNYSKDDPRYTRTFAEELAATQALTNNDLKNFYKKFYGGTTASTGAIVGDFDAKEVEKALKSVPDEFRLAVILSDVEEMSYQEIADATGVPIGTVRSRIARGRAMLRRSLESYALKEGFIKEGEDL